MDDRFVKMPVRLLERTDIDAYEKLVLAVIVDQGRRTGWTGINGIASLCGVSRDTVMRSIARLETLRLLLVDRVRGKANRYRPNLSPEDPALNYSWVTTGNDQSQVATTHQSQVATGTSRKSGVNQSQPATTCQRRIREITPPTPLRGGSPDFVKMGKERKRRLSKREQLLADRLEVAKRLDAEEAAAKAAAAAANGNGKLQTGGAT